MKKTSYAFVIFFMFFVSLIPGNRQFDKDSIKTGSGDLVITFLGHGTLMFNFNKAVIYVDPFSRVADFSALPQADLILITHHHGDHMDPAAIKSIRQEKTVIIGTQKCVQQVEGCIVMSNGDEKTAGGLKIEAVPAYNILHKRESGEPFHIKGEGNCYIITFGD